MGNCGVSSREVHLAQLLESAIKSNYVLAFMYGRPGSYR